MSAVLYQIKACAKDAGVTGFDQWNVIDLSKYGFNYIAGGCYGAVYNHPTDPNKVIKVGMKDGDGWPKYATYCLLNKENDDDHLLKVYSLHLFKDMYVAEIERLETYNYSDDHYTDAQYEHVKMRANGPLELVRLWNTIGDYNDMHLGNVMLRGNTLVVTDPYGYVTPKEAIYDVSFGMGQIDKYSLSKHLEDKRLLKELQSAEREVVNHRAISAPRRQEEGIALWPKPIYDSVQHAQRMAGILPQMPRDCLGVPTIDAIISTIVQAIRNGNNNLAFACGLQFEFRGHVPYIRKCPAVVCSSRYIRDYERRIQARVQRELAPGRDPFIHANYAELERRMLAKIGGWGLRPEVFGSANRAIAFPVYRDHFLVADTGPAIQPDNNGGRSIRYKGRTIPAKCIASRDVLKRQADADVKPQTAKQQASRHMAGPGQSRQQRHYKLMQAPIPPWHKLVDNIFDKGPKEPHG